MVLGRKLKKQKILASFGHSPAKQRAASLKAVIDEKEHFRGMDAENADSDISDVDDSDESLQIQGAGDANISSTGKTVKRKRKHGISKSDPDHSTIDTFDKLDVNQLILNWLRERNITSLTKVQRLVIPRFLRTGNDVLVQSHTGSGKTLCYVIPMLDSFLRNLGKNTNHPIATVFSVIMLPTRELATQVNSVVSDAIEHISSGENELRSKLKISKDTFSSLVLIGGYSVEQDIRTVRKLKERGNTRPFVIATPGRLRHLMDTLQQDMVWTFKDVSMLILDEADRLLEMGYQNDMTTIMGNLPKQRQVGFFSATLPSDVITFANLILKTYDFINADISTVNNRSVEATPSQTAKGQSTKTAYATPVSLENYYLLIDQREKLHFVLLFLLHLKETGTRKCAIFFLTCDIVDYYSMVLASLLTTGKSEEGVGEEILLYKIHRKMPTSKRQQNLDAFRNSPKPKFGGSNKVSGDKGVMQVLLCTDVFSRGIDIPQIEWVIQYDAPQDPNFYVHRIGRVSRAGASGNALLLLSKHEEAYVQFQLNRSIPLKRLDDNTLEAIKTRHQPYSKLKGVLVHDTFVGKTTVENGKPYLDYLESTEPEEAMLPWQYTCGILSFLRSQIAEDRDYLLAASRAFVSFTRAYSEHRLTSIFEEKKLDYGGLATSFGVLRVPRVKEILGRKLSNFVNSDTDPRTVPFKDEKRETERLKKLEEAKPVEKVKPEKKKAVEQKVQRTRTEKRQAKRENIMLEWEELSREESLAKKLKRGKITQQQYERMLSGQDAVDSEESDGSASPNVTVNHKEDESDWEKELDNFVKEWERRPPPHVQSKKLK
ncbi:RNA helicase [Babesia gibsoni]|uniref:ATP-dependent RNA helicase n=1 Tax=Babesia gibsoni TaxID=33632 RepID=A0AAD8PFW1_BABGI|nr:RNA helicase [Babesia gibsoni]